MHADAVDELRTIVGLADVLTDDDVRAGHERDWTGRWHGRCEAVVRPGSTSEVSAVLAACERRGIAVVPQGGNTGLVGGSVPRVDGDRATIVLSLQRLDTIEPVDVDAMQVTAGAGVTIAQWRTAARAAGVDAPIDFAARDSATVGGAIATNAGGSRVVRFGTMRAQVVGVEAVLADGRRIGSLAGLPKETAGLHWPSLVTGSEGTLAVVTAARVRVVPRLDHTVTALVAMTSLAAATELLGALRRTLTTLDSVELVGAEAMALVADHLGVTPPVPSTPATLVIECADHTDPTAGLAGVLDRADGVVATAVATGEPRRSELLAFRDRITEAIAAAATADGAPTFKLDVAVPVRALEQLLDIARDAAAADGARLIPFGHLAEGNLHLNHLGATDTTAIADRVLGAVADLGGTISAEHGIGVAKTAWLSLIRSPGELDALRAIKHALDPNGVLNPGVLVPAERR